MLSVFSAKHLVLVPTKAGIVFLKTSQISCVLMEAKWIQAFKCAEGIQESAFLYVIGPPEFVH